MVVRRPDPLTHHFLSPLVAAARSQADREGKPLAAVAVLTPREDSGRTIHTVPSFEFRHFVMAIHCGGYRSRDGNDCTRLLETQVRKVGEAHRTAL